MAEFNIQSDSVDVTRIMEQIRQRIREKRGTDYTEQQTRELATVKLERFLDPRQVRSDLVEHYQRLEPPAALDPIPHERPGPAPEPFAFDQDTIYASSRGPMGKLIRLTRKLLNPFLKLFFNPNTIVHAMTRQAEINAWTLQLLQQQTDLAERITKQFERAGAKFAAREELDALNYEVLNNLVVEMSRLSVDMKNHRMLVESVAGRLDFDERRARALESVVQSRSPQPADAAGGQDDESSATTGSGRTRRRRRRSRRRPAGSATADPGAAPTPDTGAAAAADTATSAADTETPSTAATGASVTVAGSGTSATADSGASATTETQASAMPDTTAAAPAETEAPAIADTGASATPDTGTAPPDTPPAPRVSTTPTAPPHVDSTPRASTPPPPSAAPFPDPVPATSPAAPPVDDAVPPAHPPSTPTPRDSPESAVEPATGTGAPASPTGDAGTDEQ